MKSFIRYICELVVKYFMYLKIIMHYKISVREMSRYRCIVLCRRVGLIGPLLADCLSIILQLYWDLLCI